MRLLVGVGCGVLAGWMVLDASSGPVHAGVSKERLAAGAALFHEKGCEYCHGATLAGTEKAPDLTAVGKRRKRDYLERQIREGGGGMPAFGEVLVGDEVATLVDFLESRRKQGPANREAMAAPGGSPKRSGTGSTDSAQRVYHRSLVLSGTQRRYFLLR